jgi:3D (Asp-Asp-Asp) domain-containing protein
MMNVSSIFIKDRRRLALRRGGQCAVRSRVDDYKLVPYRTLAVDPKVIRVGSVLYMPALDGVHLPNGEIHDGFVFAHDEGQSIKSNRIDVFVGFESDVDNTLTRSGRIPDMEPTEIYRVDEATAEQLNRRFAVQFTYNR